MLVHLRLTAPADLTDSVRETLCAKEWITNVTLQRDAVLDPPGDVLECDVAREKAGPLIDKLERCGLKERGSILVLEPSGAPFDRAEELEAVAAGHPDDAVIWEQVAADAESGADPTVSYHLFLVLAVALGAVAVLTDSAVLVVGAMVVGPDFAVVAAASAGIVLGRWQLVRRSLQLLVLSFVLAIAVVGLLCVLGRLTGMIDMADVTAPRPNTGFIWRPDQWSLVVALIAGAVGVLALSIQKTSTMVGVFISVTTVPAAGNLALGLAFLEVAEIQGSLAQLGINLAGMLVAGTLVLAFQRAWWIPVTAGAERVFRALSYGNDDGRSGSTGPGHSREEGVGVRDGD